jgi:hypothetical protein
MLERDPWWETDEDSRAVVFGHYWRSRLRSPVSGKADPFVGISPTQWFGKQGQAFCVDFSVGYRYKARYRGEDGKREYGLAALGWPERRLFFDDR